ncbi:hypothetical protein EST38_g11508 [Candolleomyces aberdarensis]|uniref:CxC1-like cysteine cluster associated with KDZ transposases domain-containing protein n=1 Tax=Candolleomyces aberdarensis TaxID=2316362 RepID=A0A4Q2D7D8_9AGAR|nr:hypothetical protein EST38_g11508 [Candolleomyces aberdarensis]
MHAINTELQRNWEDQLDTITDQYLKWKSGVSLAEDLTTENGAQLTVDFDISIVDMYSLQRALLVNVPDDEAAVSHLMARGYLSTTPKNPSLAISLRTLEFYKHLRQRKPSFGVEAFVKVLCDLYKLPFRSEWRRAFRDTFEIFLAVIRRVESRVNAALKRDTPNWRVLNSCPACMYELEGEVPLRYRLLMAMDGNDSQKRMDHDNAGDVREYKSDYWIPLVEADRWARVTRDDEDWEDVDDHAMLGLDDGDGSDDAKLKDCVKNWKAAQADSKKRVLGIFDESGWFVSACRHGIVLWATDMVKSGEQFKYPMSIVNKAMDILGDQLVIGYDIGCSFQITLANSALGPRFQASGSRCCVNAYHGYAHNFKCQTQNHPNNIPGVGIEDFETMERFFSGSNAAAGLVRHATKFRRRLYLDLYMKQADADKYLQLGQMLYDNYCQALHIINDDGLRLDETLASDGITTEDLEHWQSDQREYFGSNLGQEPEENIHRVAYVELLLDYAAARDFADKKSSAFLHALPQDYDISQPGAKTYESTRSETQRLETARRRARDKVKELDEELGDMELRLGLETRWDATMPQYHETLTYIKERRYHQALEGLQKVVVQRLFELHRLNLSGIGYKARTLLAKAMRTRSRAIQSAVNKYNRAALDIGRSDTLDFAQAAKYSFVEEFELLKNSHADLSDARWKEPVIREAMKRHQRIQRAREEIIRVNIEIQRIYTAIQDEREEMTMVESRLKAEGDPLYVIVQDLNSYRKRVHQDLR